MKKFFLYIFLIGSTTFSFGCKNVYENIPKSSETSQIEFYENGYSTNTNSVLSAINFYTNKIELDINDLDALIKRGIAFRSIGKHKQAINDFSQAIAINQNSFNAYFYRGNTKSDLTKYKSAIDDYDKAIAINPQLINAYLSKGKAQMNLLLYEEAIQTINLAIKIDSSYGLAFNDRGIIKERMNNKTGACSDWQKAVNLGYFNSQEWLDKSCS